MSEAILVSFVPYLSYLPMTIILDSKITIITGWHEMIAFAVSFRAKLAQAIVSEAPWIVPLGALLAGNHCVSASSAGEAGQ